MQEFNDLSKEISLDTVNKINNKLLYESNKNNLYKNLSDILLEEFDIYFYSIVLLDAGDDNFFIEYTSSPQLDSYINKLYPLFNNQILRKIYGFGELKINKGEEIEYFSIENEIVELFDAYPIYVKNTRMIGLLLLHDTAVIDESDIEKLKFILNQLGLSILNYKRLESVERVNKNYISSLKILKFLNKLLKEESFESIFYIILNDLYEKLNAEAGCVAVLKQGKWTTPVSLGISEDILNQFVFSDGMNVLDFSSQLQQIYVMDKQQLETQLDLSQLKVNVESLILVPIITNGECNNFVVLANFHHPIKDDVMVYIMKIADMAATALHNYDIIADKEASFPEKERKLHELREKFVLTLETLLDEIELP